MFCRSLLPDDSRRCFARNSVIEYVPVPITDIILMKITEKDRMEKVQLLMNKVLHSISFEFIVLFSSCSSTLFATEIINVKPIFLLLILSLSLQPLI